MEFSKPFKMPDVVLTDPTTKLAMNIPASLQGYPGWWNDEPERYAALVEARKDFGIEIDDFPNGTERIVSTDRVVRMKRPE